MQTLFVLSRHKSVGFGSVLRAADFGVALRAGERKWRRVATSGRRANPTNHARCLSITHEKCEDKTQDSSNIARRTVTRHIQLGPPPSSPLMAGRYYMVPTAARSRSRSSHASAEATLTTRPSTTAFTLQDLERRAGEDIMTDYASLIPESDDSIATHNRSLLESKRDANHTAWLARGGEVMQRLRWQRRKWADEDASGDGSVGDGGDVSGLDTSDKDADGDGDGNVGGGDAAAAAAVERKDAAVPTPSFATPSPAADPSFASQFDSLTHAVPSAFRFDEHPDEMRLYWENGRKADENALVRPVPCGVLHGGRGVDGKLKGEVAVADEFGARPSKRQKLNEHLQEQYAQSSETSQASPDKRQKLMKHPQQEHTPSSNTAKASSEKGQKFHQGSQQHTQPSQTSQASPDKRQKLNDRSQSSQWANASSDNPSMLSLCISIYSRPLARSTRESRQRTAAEQRVRVGQQQQQRARDDGGGGEEDIDGLLTNTESDGLETDGAVDSQRSSTAQPLFEPRFSLHETASHGGDNSEPPRPTQRIVLRGDATLEDLRRGLYCRCDDLPEARGGDGGVYGQDDAVDTDRVTSCHRRNAIALTGRKISSSSSSPPSVIIIGDQLFCDTDDDGNDTSGSLPATASRIASRWPTTLTCNHTPFRDTRLSSLTIATTTLHLRTPYYLLHAGFCEHLWTIDAVRVDADAHASSPSPVSSTTYLATHALQHPLSTFARQKASDTHYPLGTCRVCEKYNARYVAVERGQLAFFKEYVTPLCPACAGLAVGLHPNKKPARKQAKAKAKKPRSGATVKSVGGGGNGGGGGGGGDGGGQDDEDEAVTTSAATTLLASIAASTADRSDGRVWKRVVENSQGQGRGFAIVPLLD